MKTKIVENKSKTPKQVIQRLKMKIIIQLCKIFNSVIQIGFPERPRTFTAWNAFTKANRNVVSVDDRQQAIVNYETISVACGGLETVEDLKVTAENETHTLSFTHSKEEYGYGSSPDDMLYAVVLEREKKRSKVFQVNHRDDETPATINIPEKWDMGNLAVYVFMLSADGRKASDSLYIPIE